MSPLSPNQPENESHIKCYDQIKKTLRVKFSVVIIMVSKPFYAANLFFSFKLKIGVIQIKTLTRRKLNYGCF